MFASVFKRSATSFGRVASRNVIGRSFGSRARTQFSFGSIRGLVTGVSAVTAVGASYWLFGDSVHAESKDAGQKTTDLEFFFADFCPFANRAWIALLEKEEDPYNPQNFTPIHCCYYKKGHPNVQRLFEISRTVPAAYYKGQPIVGSMDLVYFVDELHPSKNSLMPADPYLKAVVRKSIEENSPIIGQFYSLLKEQDIYTAEQKSSKLVDIFTSIDKQIGEREGPYWMGEQFTALDIAFIPIFARMYLLDHYKHFNFAERTKDLKNLNAWIDACLSRTSCQIVFGDRSDESMAHYTFGPRDRKEYLKEMYCSYAANNVDDARVLLLDAPAGKTTITYDMMQKMRREREARASN